MKFVHNLTSYHLFLDAQEIDESSSSSFGIRHIASYLEALTFRVIFILLFAIYVAQPHVAI